MNEKVLNKNKNGMLVLLLVILGYAAGQWNVCLSVSDYGRFHQAGAGTCAE